MIKPPWQLQRYSPGLLSFTTKTANQKSGYEISPEKGTRRVKQKTNLSFSVYLMCINIPRNSAGNCFHHGRHLTAHHGWFNLPVLSAGSTSSGGGNQPLGRDLPGPSWYSPRICWTWAGLSAGKSRRIVIQSAYKHVKQFFFRLRKKNWTYKRCLNTPSSGDKGRLPITPTGKPVGSRQ